MITVSTLTYYPIKACRGHDAAESFVERMGLAHDRRMMVVTPDGKFLTQREHPRLALATPTLTNGVVALSAPGFDSLRVAIQTAGAIIPATIWKGETLPSVDLGDEAAQWFSEWLGAPARLVHFAEGRKRALNPKYAVSPEDHTAFADGYPILILSEESLQDLNSRLASPVPMNRFRPNLVVKGCAPFEEDSWRRIRIGDVELALVKPCARCVVTTIDKETLVQDKEPLKTLSRYRRHELGAIFGMNAIPLNEGKIAVGMEVVVTERG